MASTRVTRGVRMHGQVGGRLAFTLLAGCSPPLRGELVVGEEYVDALGGSYTIGTYVHPDVVLEPGTPWLLVLDGDGMLEPAAYDLDRRIARGDVAPIVLVGVGNHSRRDFDYTTLPLADASIDWDGEAGGVGPFFAWTRDVLVPRVEGGLDIGGDAASRGVAGHSLGGLATVYALFHHRDTFGRFGASSPSLWWDVAVPFAWEEEQAAGGDALEARLFVSVGSSEAPPMNALIDEFVRVLEAREYRGLDVSSDVYAGHNHYTAPDRALPDVLGALFPAAP